MTNVAQRFEYRIAIRYSDDADKAIPIISKLLAAAHSFVLQNPPPSVCVNELGNSGVIIMVRIWSPSREWGDVRTEMLLKIRQALEQQGIRIPFSQRVVWLQDPNYSVPESPPEHLADKGQAKEP
jgi:small-conductance mechanosensitive channel